MCLLFTLLFMIDVGVLRCEAIIKCYFSEIKNRFRSYIVLRLVFISQLAAVMIYIICHFGLWFQRFKVLLGSIYAYFQHWIIKNVY